MTGPQDGNQQRAADLWLSPLGPHGSYIDRIAAALDAAEARGRAEMAAKVAQVAQVVEHYGLITVVHPGQTLGALLNDLHRLVADLPTPAGQAGDAR